MALLEAAPCIVWSIDRDPEALQRGAALLERFPGRINLVQGRFGDMAELLSARGITGVDGVDGPDRGSGVSSNGLLHDAVIAALS